MATNGQGTNRTNQGGARAATNHRCDCTSQLGQSHTIHTPPPQALQPKIDLPYFSLTLGRSTDPRTESEDAVWASWLTHPGMLAYCPRHQISTMQDPGPLPTSYHHRRHPVHLDRARRAPHQIRGTCNRQFNEQTDSITVCRTARPRSTSTPRFSCQTAPSTPCPPAKGTGR